MGNVKRILMRLGMALALSAGVVFAMAPAQAQDKTPLQFGLAMPLSGSQSLYGKDQVQAAEWAVKDINDKGGVDGHPLKMIVLDTQADPQLGIQAANKLISVEHVPAFISAWSAVVKAIAPVANDAKVVQLSVGANSPDIARLGDYTYTTFPLADVDIRALAKYEATTLGKKRAAVLYINNETGTAAAQVYKDIFTKNGGQIVDYAGYDPQGPGIQSGRRPYPGAGCRYAAGGGADASAWVEHDGVVLLRHLQPAFPRPIGFGRRRHHRHLAGTRPQRS